MAHKDQMDFFLLFSPLMELLGPNRRIAEIGSLDINGSIRSMYDIKSEVTEYVGVDIDHGPGVDVVGNGHEFLAKNPNRFNVILSAECLEHNPFWRETIETSIESLAAPGILIFSWATTGRRVHGTEGRSALSAPFVVDQWDSYYKNVSSDELLSIRARKLLMYEAIFVNYSHKDLYWFGIKADSDLNLHPVTKLVEIQKNRIQTLNIEFLNSYKHNIQKYLRSKSETILQKVHPELPKSRFGQLIKKRAKLSLNNSRLIYPTLYARKQRNITNNQYKVFYNKPG